MKSPAATPPPASRDSSDQRPNSAPRRVVGRPFRPGQSGNPGGRPKGLASRIREATRDGEDLVAFALRVFNAEIPGVKIEHRLEALQWLSDRGWGKPVQSVELTGQEPLAPAVAVGIMNILTDPDHGRRLQDAAFVAIQRAQTTGTPELPPGLPTAR